MTIRLIGCVRVLPANLCSLMTLQSHADVKVTVTKAETIFGRSKQAKLSFFWEKNGNFHLISYCSDKKQSD